MKILVDVNLSPAWADVLIRAGVEAVHWTSIGAASAADATIMAWAREHGHVVVTHDLDFGTLLALTRASGPSVLQVRRQDVTPQAISTIVLAVLHEHAAALEKGALVTVSGIAARVRILPLDREQSGRV